MKQAWLLSAAAALLLAGCVPQSLLNVRSPDMPQQQLVHFEARQ